MKTCLEANELAIDHALRVCRPALALSSPNFLDELRARLHDEGIQEAITLHDSGAIFDWMMPLFSLQGISDAIAFDYSARNGNLQFAGIEGALSKQPRCHKLQSYWHFDHCGFRKGSMTCAEPNLLSDCPLPKAPLRKGLLNEAGFAFYLFIRDVGQSDLVGWIDQRLAVADPGLGVEGREARMLNALVEPLSNIVGTANKLWNMILSELLLGSDPTRERWVSTGGSMIAIDTLCHNYLRRSGILARFDAQHGYGPRCYAPGGCADIIEVISAKIDAREFNPTFPQNFPRFIQHAIWMFCAEGGFHICNGRQIIDDDVACEQATCPAFCDCARVPLRRG